MTIQREKTDGRQGFQSFDPFQMHELLGIAEKNLRMSFEAVEFMFWLPRQNGLQREPVALDRERLTRCQ